MKNLRMLIITSLFFTSLLANAANFDSSYTSIKSRDCTTLEADRISSAQSCAEFSGIKVKVIENDLRQSITLIRKDKEYPLDFFRTVTPAFSLLGSKIEWRYIKGQQKNLKGIIVRLKISEEVYQPPKTTSYLIVAKITAKNICVVGKISSQAKQNEKARRMLERSSKMPCL